MNDTYRLNVLALGSFGRHLGRCVVKLLSSVWLLVLIDMGTTRAVLTGRTHELYIHLSSLACLTHTAKPKWNARQIREFTNITRMC